MVSPTEGADRVVTTSHFNLLEKFILMLVQVLIIRFILLQFVY
jgi:hypothetical protein